MPRIDLTGPIDLRVILSASNLVAIVFATGVMYATITGDQKRDRETIATLQGEIVKLKDKDDAIITTIRDTQITQSNRLTALEVGIKYVQDTVLRIERTITGR